MQNKKTSFGAKIEIPLKGAFMNISEFKLFIKEHSYLFWWVKESEKENINLNGVVEAVLNYGDKQCIKKIFELIGIRKVAEIFYQDTNRERVNYYPEVVNFFNLYFKKNV